MSFLAGRPSARRPLAGRPDIRLVALDVDGVLSEGTGGSRDVLATHVERALEPLRDRWRSCSSPSRTANSSSGRRMV